MSNVQAESNVVVLNKINIKKAPVILLGDSPIISHKWAAKAVKQIRDKQMGKNTQQRGKKSPEQDYEDSLYKCSDEPIEYPTEYGFPASGFKACACRGAKEVAGLDMTKARTSFHIPGELAPIYGSPIMREDMVKVGQTIDIRYRGEFKEWATKFIVRFNASIITYDQIVNIFEYGGFGCGVGEWRPAKGGHFGMFHVGTEEEFAYYADKYGRKE
jgi:hypothetical protein|tara:strand:- start:337 stop:981 length:645 start_codon:yes stop_codon:yes gene_type:complete